MGSPTLRLARLALYFAWTLSLMPVQVVGLALRRRWTSTLPVFYHRWCCRILGFRIRVIGTPTAERPVLFAANHISYTDITILGSVIPGSFIAKAEVAKWPFFGWLAKLQRSVFVDRQVRSTATQRDAIGDRLAAGDALILFPEGTSGDGNRVLPFKSALFAAAQQGEGISPGDRSAGFARLYTPRRHADRASLSAVLRVVRHGRSGAPYVEHGGSRDGRGGGRISSADLSLAIADRARRSPAIAMRGSPAESPARCSVGRSRCRNRRIRLLRISRELPAAIPQAAAG